MDQRRRQFQEILEGILGSDEVYFHPGENTQMKYDAIVYHLSDLPAQHGNNLPYAMQEDYLVTLITRNPVNPKVKALARLRSSNFDRAYVADGLYHTSFNITY